MVLLGRVGGAPEKRGSEEHPVVTFSLATHTNYRKGEGELPRSLLDFFALFLSYTFSINDKIYEDLVSLQKIQ